MSLESLALHFLGESVMWHLLAILFFTFLASSSKAEVSEHLSEHLMSSIVMVVVLLLLVIVILCGNSKRYLLVLIQSTGNGIEIKLHCKNFLDPCSFSTVSNDGG